MDPESKIKRGRRATLEDREQHRLMVDMITYLHESTKTVDAWLKCACGMQFHGVGRTEIDARYWAHKEWSIHRKAMGV